jgi:hypothetical protein
MKFSAVYSSWDEMEKDFYPKYATTPQPDTSLLEGLLEEKFGKPKLKPVDIKIQLL